MTNNVFFRVMATNLLCWCVVLFLVDPGAAFHCEQNCDSEGLIPEELVTEFFPVEQFSHCTNPIFCDDSSLGTGHLLYGELTDEVLAVERCFSFCFNSVSSITVHMTQTRRSVCVCLYIYVLFTDSIHFLQPFLPASMRDDSMDILNDTGDNCVLLENVSRMHKSMLVVDQTYNFL